MHPLEKRRREKHKLRKRRKKRGIEKGIVNKKESLKKDERVKMDLNPRQYRPFRLLMGRKVKMEKVKIKKKNRKALSETYL